MNKGRIFVISAPSGAGKTTLLKRVLESIPELIFSISATTRKPRPNEREGRDYRFVSKQEFASLIANNELAEWQEVHANFYGTPIRPVSETIEKGNDIVLDIDVYGKKKFDKVFPQNIGILILPPSLAELERRLRKRGTETEQAIALRLDNARKEIEFAQTQGRYEHTVINDNFEEALRQILSILRMKPDSPNT